MHLTSAIGNIPWTMGPRVIIKGAVHEIAGTIKDAVSSLSLMKFHPTYRKKEALLYHVVKLGAAICINEAKNWVGDSMTPSDQPPSDKLLSSAVVIVAIYGFSKISQLGSEYISQLKKLDGYLLAYYPEVIV